jgi:hypothetical protein
LSEVGENSEALAEVGGFSGEGWSPDGDVRAFAELLSRILLDDSAKERGCSLSVPTFVLKMIERGQSLDSNAMLSLMDIFTTLKTMTSEFWTELTRK